MGQKCATSKAEKEALLMDSKPEDKRESWRKRKKHYATPKLTVYGSVEAITRQTVTGPGDGYLGSPLPP